MSKGSKFVGCEIDESDFRLLFRTAVKWGVRVDKMVTVAIRRFLSQVDPQDGREKPVDLQVFQKLQYMKRDTDTQRYLMEMAHVYQGNPTEENADLLNECCDLAGCEVSDVLQWIEEDKLVPLVSSDNDSVARRAAMWLERSMNVEEEYPSTQILDAAREAGFTETTIKTAKRELLIQSVRKPNCWVWIKPKRSIQ